MKKIILLLCSLLVLSLLIVSCSSVDEASADSDSDVDVQVEDASDDELADSGSVETDDEESSVDDETVEQEEDLEEVEDDTLETVEDTTDATEGEEIEVGVEVVADNATEVTDTTEVAEESGLASGADYLVEFVDANDDAFNPTTLTISVGDTVEFYNARDNLEAFLVGAQKASHIKSDILEPGENFIYTFDEEEPGTYTFVDGIYTTFVFKLTIE